MPARASATASAHPGALAALRIEPRLHPGDGSTTLVVDGRPQAGVVARREVVADMVEAHPSARDRGLARRCSRLVARSQGQRPMATTGAAAGMGADG